MKRETKCTVTLRGEIRRPHHSFSHGTSSHDREKSNFWYENQNDAGQANFEHRMLRLRLRDAWERKLSHAGVQRVGFLSILAKL